MDRIFIGTLTIVLDHPRLHRLSPQENHEIAESFLSVLRERIAEQGYPFHVLLELESAKSGCLTVKVNVFIAVATFVGAAFVGAVSVVAKYPEFRRGLPVLVKDTATVFKCYVRKEAVACKAVMKTLGIAEHLYVVKQGDTLTRIVAEEWGVPEGRRRQVMLATVQLNAAAFVGGDMNQLKTGAVLAQPTEAQLQGVAGSSRAG